MAAAVVAAAAAGVTLATIPAYGAPASERAAAPTGRMVTAVLTVGPSTRLPIQVTGGRVLSVLAKVRAEIVRVPAGELAQLAGRPGVLGVTLNRTGHVAGDGWSSPSGEGVFAPAMVGGNAGRPNAGAGETVALLDTGVDDTAALDRSSGRLVDALDVSGITNGQPASTSGQFTDGYGHGTYLASLIAGGPVPGSDGRAIGVAPGATIDDVKVADDTGTTSLWQILAGLNWVAAHADSVDVANLSFAVQRATYPAYGVDPLSAAVQLVRGSGVTVVAAVGNTPGQVGDPGMAPQAITVGAADLSTGAVASFSGSGNVDGMTKPDLVASGVGVLGAMDPSTLVAQQHPDAWQPDGLFRGSGTSQSTAIVAGAAAVLLADHPGWTPLQLKTALRSSAAPIDDSRAGAGLLNLSGNLDTSSTGPGNSGGKGKGSGKADGRGNGQDNGRGNGRNSGASDPSGEGSLDWNAWLQQAWLNGDWVPWLASSWSASSWSASSWSASSWSASSWSASSWSASSWSASYWGNGP